MENKCEKCGELTKSNFNFCPNCGEALTEIAKNIKKKTDVVQCWKQLLLFQIK